MSENIPTDERPWYGCWPGTDIEAIWEPLFVDENGDECDKDKGTLCVRDSSGWPVPVDRLKWFCPVATLSELAELRKLRDRVQAAPLAWGYFDTNCELVRVDVSNEAVLPESGHVRAVRIVWTSKEST